MASLSNQRAQIFEELAQTLGTDTVALEDAHYIIIDANLSRQLKNKVRDQLDNKPLLSLISASRLIECFFSVTRFPFDNFQKDADLNSFLFLLIVPTA